jgi:diadenosine tetraphosphate (Ap4A) HIT family hydrolase
MSEYCEFCEILAQKKGIIAENEQFFAFDDISLASSKRHLLVCTRQHI